MSDRPANACLTHRPPKPGRHWRLADPSYRTCRDCCDQLHRWLSAGAVETVERPDGSTFKRPASIPGLYVLLNPVPLVVEQERRGPGFASTVPVDEQIVVMRDPRSKSCEVDRDGWVYRWDSEAGEYVKFDVWYGSDGKAHREEEDPARSVPHSLASWAGMVAEERDMTGPDDSQVPTVAAWLDRHIDWISRQDWVDELWADLAKLHKQLLSAEGEPAPKPVATCIAILDSGECRTPIYMPPDTEPRAPDESITDLPPLVCPSCGADYKGMAIVRLRLANARGEAA